MGEPVEFLLLQFWNKRFWTPFAADELLCSNNFFYGRSTVADRGVVVGLLNTTFHYLQLSIVGRVNQGLGVLNTYGPDLDHILVLDPRLVSGVELCRAFARVAERPVMNIYEEVSQSDRHVLDDIAFDALGLTQGEREAVYEGVAELVRKRLAKARSV